MASLAGNTNSRNCSAIGYTSYKRPNVVMPGSNAGTLSYGANRNRCKQVSVASRVTAKTIYIRSTSGAVTAQYIHADHLGSPELITGSVGAREPRGPDGSRLARPIR